MIERILTEALLCESVSEMEVSDAIDKHIRVIINYHSKGEDVATGARVIEVYAYGLTKAGNPVIRAFQPYGDTTSRVPSWKFFRLDRISLWKPTAQTFTEPASDHYKGMGEFNPNGDDTMSVVYKVAKFDATQMADSSKDGIYQTDAERQAKQRMKRTLQSLENPITLSDIAANTRPQTSTISPAKPVTTPKAEPKQPTGPELYKTPTERGMERLRQQLNNPQKIDLTQFGPNGQRRQATIQQPSQADLDRLRAQLGDTSDRITMQDLNNRLSQPVQQPTQAEPKQPELFKTPTEQGLDRLRQQLNNPKKIDLSKIPKR